ncbi:MULTISPECIES: DUF2855 family protein [unclassified Novosphingobium]|uniref:DUF2855 family protein n=1 Tax=unclassified Novosphingobium TaxID=2644732 RepID=UPI0025F26167|nr:MULTISPECIES: DUF2855 family protein [unclassified Novosphingobium]HQV03055.1 DUF2855 family protein [Novosphingobium sp.]
MSQTVQYQRHDLSQSRLAEAPLPPLGEGEVRLRIESFSVTANNVTYAVVGDSFGYWNFFPGEGEWGVVPMWGHAVVEESRHADIAVGERVYGYLPMGQHLDVLPVSVSAGGFSDGAAHRQPMSTIYNQYSRLNADPEHDPAREGERMIFGPLFKTGFLIESMFRREGWFGAQTLICTSASSKTAMATASVARDKSPQIRRIGLTSAGNVDFVCLGGFYDEVFAYGDIAELPQRPSVLVDFAGNAGVIHAVHTALGDQLNYSCTVGATHVGEGFGRDNGPLPGPAPVLFFAPHHAVAAIQELGPKGFGEAVAASWSRFIDEAGGAVTMAEHHGLEAARSVFAEILVGKADPAVGNVIRP